MYVAFQDNSAEGGSKASLMKYDGTNWTFVGSRGLGLSGDGLAYAVEVVLDDAGNPYVGFVSGYTQGGALYQYGSGVTTGLNKNEVTPASIIASGKTIRITDKTITNVIVRNSNGAIVYSGIEKSITLNNQSAGLYIVTLNSEAGKISRKVILN